MLPILLGADPLQLVAFMHLLAYKRVETSEDKKYVLRPTLT